MELYLNGYQLEQQHGGLGNYLKSGSSEWIFTRESSLQVVELCDPSATIPSIGWSKFHEQVRKVGWDQPWGAIFGAIYPGMMVEFYPHTIVINQLVPLSNKMTASYVQIFYDKVAQQDFDFQNAFTEAYSETAQETAFIQDILEDGRMANHYHIADLPAHSRLEAGIKALESWEARNSG
jgi:choline monooxygenase